jgi:hypothetical protein
MSEIALKKAPEAQYTVMVFFSNFNERSVRTRLAIREFVERHPVPGGITAREVNYEKDREICLQYGVTGTPALFLFRKQELISRHFGEITNAELAKLLRDLVTARQFTQTSKGRRT